MVSHKKRDVQYIFNEKFVEKIKKKGIATG
jgi:hypothetical protein